MSQPSSWTRLVVDLVPGAERYEDRGLIPRTISYLFEAGALAWGTWAYVTSREFVALDVTDIPFVFQLQLGFQDTSSTCICTLKVKLAMYCRFIYIYTPIIYIYILIIDCFYIGEESVFSASAGGE